MIYNQRFKEFYQSQRVVVAVVAEGDVDDWLRAFKIIELQW